MNWTKDKPMLPGFYWIRSLMEEPQPVKIAAHYGSDVLMVCFIQDNQTYTLKGLHDGYEFYGPIGVPK